MVHRRGTCQQNEAQQTLNRTAHRLQTTAGLSLNFCLQSGIVDKFKLPLPCSSSSPCLAAGLLGLNRELIGPTYPQIFSD